MNKAKYDIFISYSTANRQEVMPFYTRLIQEGYRVFIDMDGIKTGESFIIKIVTAIESSKLMLFFRSKESNESKYTIRELKYADDINIPIVPVFLDSDRSNKQINFVLTSFDCEDYSDSSKTEETFNHIIASIKELLYEPKTEPQALFSDINVVYHIGDRYYVKDSIIGIICYLDDSGQHGKIISVEGTDKQFFHPNLIQQNVFTDLPFSEDDGEKNMFLIMQQPNWEELFPAVGWCSKLGFGFHIPSYSELRLIAKNLPIVNKSLKELGKRPISQLLSSSSAKYENYPSYLYWLNLHDDDSYGFGITAADGYYFDGFIHAIREF